MIINDIAKIGHEANKCLCEGLGDYTQKSWEEAEEWQKESAINSINYIIDNPNASDSFLHDVWMKDKYDNGWVYGSIKDANKKTHPCLVPFDKLSLGDQVKDTLFMTICKSLLPLI